MKFFNNEKQNDYPQIMQYFIIISIALSVSFCQNPRSRKTELSNKNTITKNDTVIKEIPAYKNGQYSAFYTKAKRLSDILSLGNIDSGFDSLQIRIWYPQMSTSKMILISRLPEKWEAYLYTFDEEHDVLKGIDRIVNIKSKKLKPETGWQKFTHELFGLGITTLPNSDNLPEYNGGGMDGESYSVEIAQIDKYRFYTYNEPIDHQNIEQAKQMIKIIMLINKEFNIEVY